MKGKKVIVIGGVAGGATAAARIRRLDESAEIIMIERGETVSFANCGLPYYIGEQIRERKKLMVQTADGIQARFHIDVRTQSEVIAVNAVAKRITIQDAHTVYDESFDALLLAPGARPFRPDIPGINHGRILSLRSLRDADLIKRFADKAVLNHGHVVVVGGGFIGVEIAENLKNRGLDVTLIEAASQILSPFDPEMVAFLQNEIRDHGVNLILGQAVQEFVDQNQSVTTRLADGTEITADFVVLAIGIQPDTAFLKDSGIVLDKRGFIPVNDKLQTNIPDVYAVGDAISLFRAQDHTPMTLALAGPANHQGRVAADNICGFDKSIRGLQGTSIVKVFGLTGASTGKNERILKSENIPYHSVIAHPMSHASYYPGASQMTLKLLFSHTGTILGAQCIGSEGVDKRLDVISVLIRNHGMVSDLMDQELCYAPPFSSAKDPVNMVGYMAENVLNGLTNNIYYNELSESIQNGSKLIDVRTEMEFQNGHLDQAINIPLDTLRNRLDELNPSDDLIIYCQVGLRGYYAERILKQHGYRVRNLSGGYKLVSTVFGREHRW